jgi:hypothetical protein
MSSSIDVDTDITLINDVRTAPDFRAKTFSNFKRAEVKKQLLECITENTKKVQEACFWAAELILAGQYNDLWEVIIFYMAKNIHTGNPKLPIYLETRYECFCAILNNSAFITELHARNSPNIRKLFAEIICVLCFSNKKHSYEHMKLNREEEFDLENIAERLRAPRTDYAADVFRARDPKECFIAANEFAYSLETRDTIMACYWIEWIIAFEAECKRKREPCAAAAERVHIPVTPAKYKQDIIWIFWDILTYSVDKLDAPGAKTRELIGRIIGALLRIFCVHYTPVCIKKRRYLMYFAVAILTEDVNFGAEMISNKPMIEVVINNIDNVYKVLKENEESPNTDYLYANLEKQNNIEKSLKQLEAIERFMSVPRAGGVGGADA